MMIFVDIETTGLDPATDVILEVGMALVHPDTFKVEAVTSRLVSVPNLADVVASVDRVVLDMHNESGLWAELRQGLTNRVTSLDIYFANVVKAWSDGEKLPMVGNSVHFDRAFLKVHMPQTEAAFHYRNIDLSGIREAVRLWAPDRLAVIPVDKKKHRALSDIDDSINLARWAKRVIVGSWS